MPTIRRAVRTDWPAIQRLLSSRKLPTDGAQEHLREFLLAEGRGGLVGCIGLERYGSIGLLRSLAVERGSSGEGIGSRLVQALLEQACQSGVGSLYLLTTTGADFFPRFGFVAVPRSGLPAALEASAELRGACPASAIVMRRGDLIASGRAP